MVLRRLTVNTVTSISLSVQLVRWIQCAYISDSYSHVFEGFDTTFIPRHSVVGRDGIKLQDKWTDHPFSYMTIAVDGFPNWYVHLLPYYQQRCCDSQSTHLRLTFEGFFL